MTMLQDRIAEAMIRGRTVADDTDIGLVVKYIGAQASGTVEVSAIGDILFKHGAVAAEVADTTVSTDGTIDVSDAAENTFGEVLDLINASANWKAYLVDVLRADSSDASTGSLLVMAATAAKVAGGIALLKDTSKVLNLSVLVKGGEFPNDSFAKNSASVVEFEQLEKGKWAEELRVISKNTFASGTNKIRVYRVNRLTGTATLVFERDGAATTVEQDLALDDNNGRGLASNPDEHLLVRMIGSVACTGYVSSMGKVV